MNKKIFFILLFFCMILIVPIAYSFNSFPIQKNHNKKLVYNIINVTENDVSSDLEIIDFNAIPIINETANETKEIWKINIKWKPKINENEFLQKHQGKLNNVPVKKIKKNKTKKVIDEWDYNNEMNFSLDSKELKKDIESVEFGWNSTFFNFTEEYYIVDNSVNDVFIYDCKEDNSCNANWRSNNSFSWWRNDTDGIIGGYITLDGIKDKVETADINTGYNVSYSLWFRAPAFTVANAVRGLLTKQLNANDACDELNIYIDSDELAFCMENSSGSNILTKYFTSNFNTNQWYHAVFTTSYDGVNTNMSMYINGTLVSSTLMPGARKTVDSNEYWIGSYHSYDNRDWNGDIDEVMIFNKTLSQSEINNIYNQGLNGNPSNISTDDLVGYWDFEGSLSDKSGNGYLGQGVADAYIKINRTNFPNVTYIIASNFGLDIIDASNNKLWMGFSTSDSGAGNSFNMIGGIGGSVSIPKSVKARDGKIYVAVDSTETGSNGGGGLVIFDFANDDYKRYNDLGSNNYNGNYKTRNNRLGLVFDSNVSSLCSAETYSGRHCVDTSLKKIGSDVFVAVSCRDTSNIASVSVTNTSNMNFYCDNNLGYSSNPQVHFDTENNLIYNNYSHILRHSSIITSNFSSTDTSVFVGTNEISSNKYYVFAGGSSNLSLFNISSFNFVKSYGYSGADYNILAGASNDVRSIGVSDDNKTVWVGTYNGGAITEIDTVLNTATYNWTYPTDLLSNNITSIYAVADSAYNKFGSGSILLGTNFGAQFLSWEENKLINSLVFNPNILYSGLNNLSCIYNVTSANPINISLTFFNGSTPFNVTNWYNVNASVDYVNSSTIETNFNFGEEWGCLINFTDDGLSFVTEQINISVGSSEIPNVSLNYPQNNSILLFGTNDFNCSATTINYDLVNITLFVWNSTGDIIIKDTNYVSGLSNSSLWNKNVGVGNYSWNCKAYNINNGSSFASKNYSFEAVSNLPPFITLISPVNDKIFYNDIINFTFNVTDTDNFIIENVSMYLDGNLSYFDVNNENYTSQIHSFLKIVSFSSHYWYVVAVDENGKSRTSQTYYFKVQEQGDSNWAVALIVALLGMTIFFGFLGFKTDDTASFTIVPLKMFFFGVSLALFSLTLRVATKITEIFSNNENLVSLMNTAYYISLFVTVLAIFYIMIVVTIEAINLFKQKKEDMIMGREK